MSYGHAERNLALIRQLEAEMRQLFGNQAPPDQEQLYGHAERNLALIRQLEAETRQLLAAVADP